MKVRFQADSDFNQIIIRAVLRREPSIDIVTPHAAGLHGCSDLEVLAIAAREGRILLTHDRRTMPHHFASFIADQTSSGVLIISRRLPVAQVAEDLLLIWACTESKEWINRLWSLLL